MKITIHILLFTLICVKSIAQDEVHIINFQEQSFSVNRIIEGDQKVFKPNKIEFEVYVDTTTTTRLLIRNSLFPAEFDEFGEELVGQKNIEVYNIFICNDSSVNRKLQIEDSRIVLVQEAIDTTGSWVPIEYFLHSTCGNSYSSLELPNGFCTSGVIAKYDGDYDTKLRVKLLFNNQIVYSNVYRGRVNRSQLVQPSKLRYNSF